MRQLVVAVNVGQRHHNTYIMLLIAVIECLWKRSIQLETYRKQLNMLEDKSHLPISEEMKKVMEEIKALALGFGPVTLTTTCPSDAEIARANRECWSDPLWWSMFREPYERKIQMLKSREGNNDAIEYCFRPPSGVRPDESPQRDGS
jgi:hypothetical protein